MAEGVCRGPSWAARAIAEAGHSQKPAQNERPQPSQSDGRNLFRGGTCTERHFVLPVANARWLAVAKETCRGSVEK